MRAAVARHWPLLIPLAFAAWLRFKAILPGNLFGDAAEYATVASSLAAHPFDMSYPDIEGFGPTPFVSQPPLVLYLFALGIRLTGSNVAGPLLVSALLGTATVAVLYAVGVLAHNRWTGAVAAAFLAVLPYHVRASREAQLDAAFTFFLALAMLAFLLWQARPTDLRALGLGLAAAATTFSKLPGFVVFLIVAFPFLQAAWRERETAGWRGPSRHAALVLAPTGVLLVAYTGLLWWLRATSNLLAKLSWQAGRVGGEDTVTRPWHWYFTETEVGLPAQLGLLLLLLALAGLALVVTGWIRSRTDRPALTLVVGWAIIPLLLLASSNRKEWFYAIPVNPALALLAAWPVGLAVQAMRPEAAPFQSKRGHGGPRAPVGAAPASSAVTRRRVEAVPARRPASMSADARAVVRQSTKPMALGAVALFASLAVWAPATAAVSGPGTFGTGVRDAALWIHGEDPQAVQVGTTLGRFTLHFYNGQPTYHYWLNHTFIERGIAAGQVRFVIIDGYASDAGEQAWLASLVERHQGVVVQEYQGGGQVQVRVYRLG